MLKMIGDIDFWTWLPKEEWIYSVGFFTTKPGKEYLSKKLLEYKEFKQKIQLKDYIAPKSSEF
jgi:hypothetical protein